MRLAVQHDCDQFGAAVHSGLGGAATAKIILRGSDRMLPEGRARSTASTSPGIGPASSPSLGPASPPMLAPAVSPVLFPRKSPIVSPTSSPVFGPCAPPGLPPSSSPMIVAKSPAPSPSLGPKSEAMLAMPIDDVNFELLEDSALDGGSFGDQADFAATPG